MARISVTRRLLQRLSFATIKEINNSYALLPRKSKEEMIRQIIYKVGTNLQLLVSNEGPFPLSKWNDIVTHLGGNPRKSFDSVSEEIARWLDPVFDEFDGDITVSQITQSEPALLVLSRKLGTDLENLKVQINNIDGRNHLHKFVTQFRESQSRPNIVRRNTAGTLRVASTRVVVEKVESLTQAWLHDYLIGADRIDIAAGFYDVDFLRNLLHRHPSVQQIRLLFNGLGGSRLEEQCSELNELKNDLTRDNRSVDIKLAFVAGIFHSKLFLAGKGSIVQALVGSANATNAALTKNEEILVELKDDGTLDNYFNKAWGKANDINKIDLTAKSLIAFFRTGSLYFKPTESLTRTYNPFRELLKLFSNEEKSLLGGIKLPHANQESGIGPFNLTLAIQGEDFFENDNPFFEISSINDEQSKRRASIKPYSIETCFGYWVPNTLDNEWQDSLEKANSHKKEKLEKFKSQLRAISDEDLKEKFEQYVKAVEAEMMQIPDLSKHIEELKINPFKERDGYKKFVNRIRSRFDDEKFLDRLALPFSKGAIPEIWDDLPAYEDFKSSFFDYLNHVAQLDGSKPKVPKAILSKLNYLTASDGNDLEKEFEIYLKKNGWSSEDWKLI